MIIDKKRILYINASENTRKFYGINNLNNGDSVLITGGDGSFIDYLYTKKKKIGKWRINVTDFGTAPSHIFTENI